MPFLQEDLEKFEELYNIIESHKEHEYAAPTYKDSHYLSEIAEIILRQNNDDIETLEDIIPAFWYLTESYDSMCRAGMSVKYYTPQLQAHTKLMKLKGYDSEEMQRFEECFYLAVKARNYYEPDDCSDLVEIVSGSLSEEKIQQLIEAAQESRRSFIKNDPIEKTEEYLAVIDEVEEQIDKNKTTDFCFEHWNLKAEYLFEHGIIWHSPAQLNPNVMFD